MSLKRIITLSKLKKDNPNYSDNEFEIPGEPFIYSFNLSLTGSRALPRQEFRNRQYRSILRCVFPRIYKQNVPVVLLVRYFVSPPSSEKNISPSALRSEKIPATGANELAEYFLSHIEMLHRTLFDYYRQLVKVDMEKFYSNRPRIQMKFMKWDEYVKLQSYHSNDAKTEVDSKAGEVWMVQSELKGNEPNKENSGSTDKRKASKGTSSNDSALPDSTTKGNPRKKKRRPTPIPDAGET